MARRHSEGFGCLFKDRVVDIDGLVHALGEVSRGGTVVTPTLWRAFSVADPPASWWQS